MGKLLEQFDAAADISRQAFAAGDVVTGIAAVKLAAQLVQIMRLLEPTPPQRLRLSRAKGFNLQAASRALNGLEVVNVARPSKWGNPWRVGGWTQAQCVEFYRDAANGLTPIVFMAGLVRAQGIFDLAMGQIESVAKLPFSVLRGKNLACWCGPGEPCHADVLLEIANSDGASGVVSDAQAPQVSGAVMSDTFALPDIA